MRWSFSGIMDEDSFSFAVYLGPDAFLALVALVALVYSFLVDLVLVSRLRQRQQASSVLSRSKAPVPCKMEQRGSPMAASPQATPGLSKTTAHACTPGESPPGWPAQTPRNDVLASRLSPSVHTCTSAKQVGSGRPRSGVGVRPIDR